MKKVIVFCGLALMMSGCLFSKLNDELVKQMLEEVQICKNISGLDKAEKLSVIYKNINGKNIFSYVVRF
ncbi:hypothetical protein [Candidatus Endomicrobiellum trichonymphae]|uniref:hypothetical protein n=1 Tax=Endomicrobium trichonymphae TaxID=1408204 RepID=UPI000864A814|nr:hypothetical protein [Candidatus Endomicrobium trichonymphae]BAV59306.1 hypothetical protein RSTT_P2-001 [Candidatus Endomicrobium trichonymphae]